MTGGRDRDGAGGAPSSRPNEPARLLEDPRLAPPETSTEAWAVELLRAADPYELPGGRKQRVRLRLQPASLARAPGWLRPAIVVAVVVACGAASAALGPWRGWPGRTFQKIVGSKAAPAATAGGADRAKRAAIARPAEPIPPPIAGAPAPPIAEAPASPRAGLEPVRAEPPRSGAPRAAASPSSRQRPAPAVSDEDTAPVMEAMRALRLENNPVRARGLLAHYLDQHPNGTLADEALAMSIQAAVAHHDTDAPALAARYLKLHPEGPFRALAEETLAAARGP